MTAGTASRAQPSAPGQEVPGEPGRPPVVRRITAGWPLSRVVAAGIAIMVLFAVVAITVGGVALARLASARNAVVDQIDPAAFQASQLYAALLNQETGLRGYALTGDRVFLQPVTLGRAGYAHSLPLLRRDLAGLPPARDDLALVVTRAAYWQASYARPAIQQIARRGRPLVSPDIHRGKADFDRLRQPLADLQAYLSARRHHAVASLHSSAAVVDWACIAIAVGLLALVTALTIGMRGIIVQPLSRLAADARRVADGDFGHPVARTGPLEVQGVGADVDQMRQRILQELSAVRASHSALEARTQDLQRSNAELEQFAYVASHDLQEPLRKVTSFCQLLQRRYAGQLDDKADQYIAYAVDGAKRMQVLINDLLAFSRVGRSTGDKVPVPAAALLADARANLATAVTDAGAVIEAGELPVVTGEPALLTAVFQNLLSNAIKFRGEQPPRIAVAARPDGQVWEFSVTDNGIGVEPEYADRIFVIFQRLHDRASYSGTGIGLAMCRKIIEYHDGRIWLDTTYQSGSRFCFTLPGQEGQPDG